MRCCCCGGDKDGGNFSGALKKEPMDTRRCTSCTAAAVNGATCEGHGGSSVVVSSASAVGACVASHEASHYASDTLGTRPSIAATSASASVTGENEAASAAQGGKTSACSACGKQLVVDSRQDWRRCGRCQQAFYCETNCHWKWGERRQACREQFACVICLDDAAHPLPIPCGCGCRGAAGCAHVVCKVACAAHQGPGYHKGWHTCPTCKQQYTGPMFVGLAEALWECLKVRPAEDDNRLAAQNCLASAYRQAGRYAKAESLYRDIQATARHVRGPNHADTLVVAGNLGNALLGQGKHSDAEAVYRDTLKRKRRVLGGEHESTLHTAGSLATALQSQGKYGEAEPVLRETLAIMRRVLGEGHENTLATARFLALLLSNTGKHAEAEELGRSALTQAQRTLGPEHPETLQIARILATALGEQGQAKEAEALLKATVATMQRVLGTGHPVTHRAAEVLRNFQRRS